MPRSPDAQKANTPLLRAALSLACCLPMLAHAEGGLPQRNLLVEWRVGGQGQAQQRNQGIRTGQIIVDSRGGVVGRTSIGMETIQTESQTETVQQVQVLNGGQARFVGGQAVGAAVLSPPPEGSLGAAR